MMVEEITTKNNVKLLVQKRETNGQVEVLLQMKNTKNCLLHWGLAKDRILRGKSLCSRSGLLAVLHLVRLLFRLHFQTITAKTRSLSGWTKQRVFRL